MLNDIKKIIPTVDKNGSFHTWAHVAKYELVWSILINNIGLNDPQPCDYTLEWKGEIPESSPPPEPPPSPEFTSNSSLPNEPPPS